MLVIWGLTGLTIACARFRVVEMIKKAGEQKMAWVWERKKAGEPVSTVLPHSSIPAAGIA